MGNQGLANCVTGRQDFNWPSLRYTLIYRGLFSIGALISIVSHDFVICKTKHTKKAKD
jgi:hypothetical protein